MKLPHKNWLEWTVFTLGALLLVAAVVWLAARLVAGI